MAIGSYRLMPAATWRVLAVATGLFVATIARADVTIAGSNHVLPVVKRAAGEFQAQTGIRIAVEGGGSERGIAAALEGSAQIGMVSRELGEDEARRLVAQTVGYDAIAVFVNERNGMVGLTRAQITDLYSGRIKDWQALDARAIDGRVVLIGKRRGRTTRDLFDGFFGLRGREYPAGTQLIGANLSSILYGSIDPLSIGYVSLGWIDDALRQGAPIKVLAVDGIEPTPANVRSGKYPYKRPLILVTRGRATGQAARFIDWLRSPAGQAAVRAEGFVALEPAR